MTTVPETIMNKVGDFVEGQVKEHGADIPNDIKEVGEEIVKGPAAVVADVVKSASNGDWVRVIVIVAVVALVVIGGTGGMVAGIVYGATNSTTK
jgi:hypothetical protein